MPELFKLHPNLLTLESFVNFLQKYSVCERQIMPLKLKK